MSTLDQRPLPRRLRKCLAEGLGIPLQEADLYFAADRVRVVTPDNPLAQSLPPEALVFEDDVLLLDGNPLPAPPPLAYALLNKPKHVTSSARDPEGKSDLAPYLSAMPRGCFPVGRLDRETTGLLFFTNDGELASAVLRPDHHTTKTYWLWLDEVLGDADPRLESLLHGVEHNGEVLRAHGVRVAARSDHATELELTLTQGRKRQVRFMCRALDLHLVHLHRKRIGPLTDVGLALGNWRLLSEPEVRSLWRAAGGRELVRGRKLAALERLAQQLRSAGTPHVRLELALNRV